MLLESGQVEGCNQQESISSRINLSDDNDSHSVPEDDDEEDDDVDFNPFLKESSSPEASSSISSDEEGGDANVVNVGSPSACRTPHLVFNLNDEVQDCAKNEEDFVMQRGIPPEGGYRKESDFSVNDRRNRREVASSAENIFASKETVLMERIASSNGNKAVEDASKQVSTDPLHSVNGIMDFDDEDAICRRTRARYSLANCSLDDLETFLQETDDDEDVQNVDDEEEYRKFLTAVLQGGENEAQSIQENGNVDDEDEDTDADFEIEIEEALDSDLDESMPGKQSEARGAGRRPKTRQNNRDKKKLLLGQANRPLRPLVPLPPLPCPDYQRLPPDNFLSCPPSSQAGLVNGFTPHQIGQLHCLIHEHTQLLLQIFSLCVLDPSRQKVAAETRELITELVHERDKVLSWRKVPYPDYCFCPPYIHPSVSDGLPIFHHSTVNSSSSGHQKGVLDTSSVSHSSSPFGERCTDRGYVDSLENVKDSLWIPRVRGPVLSILDAAPLSLVGSYMADVSKAVQEYPKLYVEGLSGSRFEKEPLFPYSSNSPIPPEANSEVLRVAPSQGPTTVASSLNDNQTPKKSLAAALLESTKKQSIAFAPKEIVKLSQRFYPLFNSALYPHKPPPPTVANRLFFTDTEDKLLAMGIMEYNTDWKAIRRRFLPSKSEHQIFVRQKNRCSSKAPENPIKDVRRMKTSPLTAEEKARIHKGLKVFKLDWMAIWQYIVPYRDPSLLPRQWRVALGIQKSYKMGEAKKEKRHLYEMQRRLGKAAGLAKAPSEKEDNLDISAAEVNKSENDNVEDEDEAYVHEAFLADWKYGSSGFVSSELTLGSLNRIDLPPGISLQQGFCASELPAGSWYGGLRPGNPEFHFSHASQHLQNASHFTHVRSSTSSTMASNHFSPDCLSKSSKNQVNLRPNRVRRRKDAQLVKLAPDLPPVNLPPSVRVISQSAFNNYHCVASHSTTISRSGVETENSVPRLAHVVKRGTKVAMNSENKESTPSSHKTATLCPENPRLHSDQLTTDNGADKDLQMHPLLLQGPEDGRLPHCTANSSISASNTFNFIERNQLQANFSHSLDADSTVDVSLSSKIPTKSCTIDFHPLLQRKDDGNIVQIRDSSNSVNMERHVSIGQQATAPMPASPNDMADELDLDIHLSSTSRNKKLKTGRKVPEHHYNGFRKGLLNVGIMRETNRATNSSLERSENCSTDFISARSSNQEHFLGNHTVVLSNNTSRHPGDFVGDQSISEIVMEQEELSDSEGENGEDVEFECEEMDDSEREESDRE